MKYSVVKLVFIFVIFSSLASCASASVKNNENVDQIILNDEPASTHGAARNSDVPSSPTIDTNVKSLERSDDEFNKINTSAQDEFISSVIRDYTEERTTNSADYMLKLNRYLQDNLTSYIYRNHAKSMLIAAESKGDIDVLDRLITESDSLDFERLYSRANADEEQSLKNIYARVLNNSTDLSPYELQMELYEKRKKNTEYLLNAREICKGDECIDYENRFLQSAIESNSKILDVAFSELRYSELESGTDSELLESISGTYSQAFYDVSVKLTDDYKAIGLLDSGRDIKLNVKLQHSYDVNIEAETTGNIFFRRGATSKNIKESSNIEFILNPSNGYSITQENIEIQILLSVAISSLLHDQKGQLDGDVILSSFIEDGSFK